MSAIRSLHEPCRAAKFGRDLGKLFGASLRPTPQSQRFVATKYQRIEIARK
jgi:hypothetical protein